MSQELNDFTLECVSREAFNAYGLERGFLVEDADGNVYPAQGFAIDWIGQIMQPGIPPVITSTYFVNVRYMGDPAERAMVTRRQRVNRLSIILSDNGVTWVNPDDINAYPRTFWGGMLPYTIEAAQVDLRELGLGPKLSKKKVMALR